MIALSKFNIKKKCFFKQTESTCRPIEFFELFDVILLQSDTRNIKPIKEGNKCNIYKNINTAVKSNVAQEKSKCEKLFNLLKEKFKLGI